MQQMWALGWWSDIVVVLISVWHDGQDIFTECGPRAYPTWTTRTSDCGTEFGSALKGGWDWLEPGYTEGIGIVVWFGGWLSKIVLYT